jgi:hypothetical protein
LMNTTESNCSSRSTSRAREQRLSSSCFSPLLLAGNIMTRKTNFVWNPEFNPSYSMDTCNRTITYTMHGYYSDHALRRRGTVTSLFFRLTQEGWTKMLFFQHAEKRTSECLNVFWKSYDVVSWTRRVGMAFSCIRLDVYTKQHERN